MNTDLQTELLRDFYTLTKEKERITIELIYERRDNDELRKKLESMANECKRLQADNDNLRNAIKQYNK